MNVNPNTFLQNLSCAVQYNVKHKLKVGGAWKLVADYCNIRDDYGLMEASSNSGEALFNELCARRFSVAELCEALAKCDLLQILALFQEPVPLQIEAQPLVLSEAKTGHSGTHGISIKEGHELKLKAVAKGIPPPTYEWHFENRRLSSDFTGVLRIEKFGKENEGVYWCKILQEQETSQIWKITEDVVVTLSKSSEKDRPKVAAKKALLIANQTYNFDSLLAPASDSTKLRNVLKDVYDFDVTVKKDLTGEEMKNVVKEFWRQVPENSYVIFYFAGHGFQISNDLFLMGVDEVEPKDFCFEHAMSHQEVIQEGSQRNPSLLLMLCDTCQSQLQDDKYQAINKQSPPKYNYLPYPNVIQGYATSRNGEAYEVAGERANEGLFTKHLIKVLKSQANLCVSEILDKVREGLNKEANKYGDVKRQVPMVVTTTVRNHRLSDSINKRKKLHAKTNNTNEAADT